jgi:hypothetical protein
MCDAVFANYMYLRAGMSDARGIQTRRIGRVERVLEGSCLQLLRGASSMAVESRQVRERPFGLSAEGVASNAPPVA